LSSERDRVHLHHLKGSLWCASCHRRDHEHRMIYNRAVGSRGVYFYFIYRSSQLGLCDSRYVAIETVEDALAAHVATMQFTPEFIASVRGDSVSIEPGRDSPSSEHVFRAGGAVSEKRERTPRTWRVEATGERRALAAPKADASGRRCHVRSPDTVTCNTGIGTGTKWGTRYCPDSLPYWPGPLVPEYNHGAPGGMSRLLLKWDGDPDESRGLRRTSRDLEIGCRIEDEGSEELLKQPGASFAIVSPRLAKLMIVVLSRERCKFAALDRRCQRELANGDDVGVGPLLGEKNSGPSLGDGQLLATRWVEVAGIGRRQAKLIDRLCWRRRVIDSARRSSRR
jgi:hypothetical protein